METESSRWIVNKVQLADLFKMSASGLDLWQRRGCPIVRRGRRGAEARYDLRAVIPWFRKWKDGNQFRRDLDRARTELAAAQTRRAAFELAKLRREYLPVEMIERAWKDEVLRFRAKILGLSSRLAAPLSAINDPAIIKSRIDDHVYDALTELSDPSDVPGWLAGDAAASGESDAPDGEAATAAHRKRVGRRKPRGTSRVAGEVGEVTPPVRR